jgi:TetR/AcrR family transcriptional regulator, transcriptional repressor for nem operon
MGGSITTDRIIAAAERRMREGGFHGFSFREIAAEVGIKSASVHHHFPTKEDLAAAVARAYTERFIAALGDPADPERTPAELMAHYVGLIRRTVVAERRMCLACMLASEALALPRAVHAEARAFSERSLTWLEAVLARAAPDAGGEDVRAMALRLMAALNGALLLAHSLGDAEVFESVVAGLGEPLPVG